MKRVKYILLAIALAIIPSVGIILQAQDTYATALDDLNQKYLSRGLLQCYAKRLKNTVTIDTEISNNGIKSIIQDPDSDKKERLVGLYPDTSPSTNDEYSCAELFESLGFNINTGNAAAQLQSLGYTKAAGVSRCAEYTFYIFDQNNRVFRKTSSPQICASGLNSTGTAYDSGGRISVSVAGDSEDSYAGTFTMDKKEKTLTYTYGGNEYDDIRLNYNLSSGSNWVSQMNTLDQAFKDHMPYAPNGSWDNDDGNLLFDSATEDQQHRGRLYYGGMSLSALNSDDSATYKLGDYTKAFPTGVKTLLGLDYDANMFKFSKKQQAAIYQKLITTYYDASSSSCSENRDDAANATGITYADDSDNSGWHLTKLYNASGEPRYCAVSANNHVYDEVYGVKQGVGAMMVSDGKVGFAAIAKWLLDNGPSKIDAELVIGGDLAENTELDPKQSKDSESDTVSEADACTGGSPKLGWILCPIINGLQAVLESVYEGVVEPLLQVDVSAFDTSSGIYGTWQVFQNMANIVFVIMFLITIFSQITGFGIDNFGVKRLLPKIIIAAILVNLSYIICQLLVDVSNIAGVSLKGLFDSIEVNGVRGTGVGSAIATFASGGALATTAVVAGVTAEFWLPALLLPFLLGLIGVLIGLIFMLILLGVRQAGVIILVILSPVAFVMYMLPNTKPVFDKWKKYFTSLLLLFPICSAMIGGCGLAGRIIGATADGFWMALLGALLSVVPFFLIPGMVKSTMGGLGAIGSMLTNAQGRITGGIQGAARFGISNSNMMKNLQGRQQERLRERERGRLQSTVNRISRTPENARTDRQKRQLALAQTQLNKMTQEDAEAAVGRKALDYNQAYSAAQSRQLNAEIDAIKTQNVNSGLAGKVGDLENDDDEFKGMDEEGKYASLADALYDTDFSKDDNKAMTYALVDQLMASGHHGEQALYQILQKKGKAGDAQAVRSIAGAMKLNNNFGGLKTASRLTYDYVNDVANGSIAAGATMGANEVIGNRLGKSGDVKGVNFGNMTQEALVGANVEELTRYADAFQAGRLNEEQAEQLKKLAVAAKGNERLASRRKGKVDTQLDRIISGTPAAANTGEMVEGMPIDTRSASRQASAGPAKGSSEYFESLSSMELRDAILNPNNNWDDNAEMHLADELQRRLGANPNNAALRQFASVDSAPVNSSYAKRTDDELRAMVQNKDAVGEDTWQRARTEQLRRIQEKARQNSNNQTPNNPQQ